MESAQEILIADRNPHIRDFLRRELSACGYQVRMVENGKELLKLIDSPIPFGLIVMDPYFPDVDALELAAKIVGRIPQLPVVLFCMRETDDIPDFGAGNVFYVEKNGYSIDMLKEVIQHILAGSATHAPPCLKSTR